MWAQSLDAEGIDAYLQHLQALFVRPVLPATPPVAGRSHAHEPPVKGKGDKGGEEDGAEGDDAEDDDEEEEGAAGGERGLALAEAARRWAVEQLCGAAALPDAALGVRAATARWLAAAGLLSLEGAAHVKVCIVPVFRMMGSILRLRVVRH